MALIGCCREVGETLDTTTTIDTTQGPVLPRAQCVQRCIDLPDCQAAEHYARPGEGQGVCRLKGYSVVIRASSADTHCKCYVVQNAPDVSCMAPDTDLVSLCYSCAHPSYVFKAVAAEKQGLPKVKLRYDDELVSFLACCMRRWCAYTGKSNVKPN